MNILFNFSGHQTDSGICSQFDKDCSIKEVYNFVKSKNNTECDFTLSYSGTLMSEEMYVRDYNITNGSHIDVNYPLIGGARPQGSKKKISNLNTNTVVNSFITFDDEISCSNNIEEGKTNILELKTIRSTAFKTLFDSIKDILTDVNLIFDSTGMKMLSKNGSSNAMVHLKIKTEELEHYYCEIKNNKPIIVGINVLQFFKIIKTVDSKDTISFFIQKSDTNIFHIKYENDNNTVTSFSYKILDIKYDSFKIPDKDFNSVITLPSGDFQKYMRDMNNLNSSVIDIKTIDDTIHITCDGDNQQRVSIRSNSNVRFTKQTNTIIQGKFNLKYLLLFIKATNLCPTVNIYIENEYPLVMEYSVASLGYIRFILLPN